MKTKMLTLLISAVMISLGASSQTIKDNIDKLAKDKSTRDKADRADVLIHKKVIYDSVQIKTTPAKVVSKTTPATGESKIKHKQKKYKKKTKKSSK
jgi:hypothetical protein